MFYLKLKSKKGGFKEILYDNLTLIIVLSLFLGVCMKIFSNVEGLGEGIVDAKRTLNTTLTP